MPCREIAYSGPQDRDALRSWLRGRENPGDSVDALVQEILDTVRQRGDEALVEYTRRFDCPDFALDRLRLSQDAIANAADQIPAEDLAILAEAAERIRAFHERQRENSWFASEPDGTILGQMVVPVDRVGLYVPGGQGGQTPLVSSLLMNAIPAQVAGVPQIAVVSPPRPDGTLNPLIPATAHLLGITEVYCLGSAWAVAALAFGTASVPAVDVIAGPGNIFVTAAKRLLVGRVGIDMIAGPSEIVILSDGTADPAWLAADLLSQAEHDPLASSILVTPDKQAAAAVRAELEVQIARLPRGEIAAKSLAEWGAMVVTPDLDTAIEVVNALAPEHLELALSDPWPALTRIRHAGAVFMGHHSPEPVGDYFAGPNHVLPTLGTARFSQALSVENFRKKTSIIATSRSFVAEHGAKIARLARLEGLEAHARSVESRLKK